MGIVLKGGNVVTATDNFISDVRIENEKIVAIGDNPVQENDEVIDVSGYYLLPGGIDCHTHFDLSVGSTKTADDFTSGTRAAIVGGTTTIIDYATQYKGETLSEALDNQFKKAHDCYCDYGFHMGITDWNDCTREEMALLVNKGITSFKLYMAYKNNLQVDDGVIYQVLKRSKEIGALVTFHCENGDVIDVLVKEAKANKHYEPIYHAKTRPEIVEKEAISRVIHLAKLADAPVYIVHLSTQSGLFEIVNGRKNNITIMAETCPQYLLLDDSYYERDGAKYVMSPPLRKIKDSSALWMGIGSGEIDTIATDHCSFNFKGQKDLGIDDFSKIPNGAPGVEDRLGLIYTYGVLEGKISLSQMVEITSTNPAKIFGLYPQKGTIEVGSDADIIVWDPEYETTIKASHQTQNVDYNPYEGFKRCGRVAYGFLRGKKIVKDGVIINNEPLGKFLQRKPFKGVM